AIRDSLGRRRVLGDKYNTHIGKIRQRRAQISYEDFPNATHEFDSRAHIFHNYAFWAFTQCFCNKVEWAIPFTNYFRREIPSVPAPYFILNLAHVLGVLKKFARDFQSQLLTAYL